LEEKGETNRTFPVALLQEAATSAVGGSAATVGVDLVRVDRVRKLVNRPDGRFEQLVFTPDEIRYCRSKRWPAIHFAGHLAAKEAAFKALGLSWSGPVSWREIHVAHRKNGTPTVSLSGRLSEMVSRATPERLTVSIAHDEYYAVAVAVLHGTGEHSQ